MHILVPTIVIIYASTCYGLVVPKVSHGEMANYYEVDTEVKDQPIIQYMKDGDENAELAYMLLVPKQFKKYDAYVDKSDINKYVVVTSKLKLLDLDPDLLIRRLDQTKQMVMWLNLYCDVHPNCDKTKLNDELEKMVSLMGSNQNANL